MNMNMNANELHLIKDWIGRWDWSDEWKM